MSDDEMSVCLIDEAEKAVWNEVKKVPDSGLCSCAEPTPRAR